MKEFELEELRHKNIIEEIESERKAKIEAIRLQHDLEMQRQRIKSAEIKRTIQEKHYLK